ncbi:MaoC family dehydratase [Zoogloea dura]|jgi:acyl dehydratase|uniref:MaoC family dehydratase n=1 Tax=Zoogloea dura TaxID=2728840 RepID=A0A848GA96_9RHOO|nr:MaoC family dehydratase [Zoogloea dura]NML28204.1 MaoC family dehydratase [Zoogloea dura]
MTSQNTRRFDTVRPGETLPALPIPITVALIASGAIATRDYFPGHHDKDAALALGSPHVFMNILTTSGLAQRYVEEWAGPAAVFKDLKIKLGAPNYPGDTMSFTGEVTHTDAASRTVVVSLKGRNSMGNHVTGTATLVLP